MLLLNFSIQYIFKICYNDKNIFLLTKQKMTQKLIQTAKKYIGTPYKFGAKIGDVNHFDCSSFTCQVFKETYNIDLPRQSKDQAKVGKNTSFENAKPGDLMFFDTVRAGNISHVGIISGFDTNKNKPIMIHANSISNKVVEEVLSGKYWTKVYVNTKKLSLPTEGNITEKPTETIGTQITEDAIENDPRIEFADLKPNHEQYKSISYFASKNIINFGKNIAFFPNNFFTRAEFSKVLTKTLDIPIMIIKNTFPDNKDHWCRDYAMTLLQKNIIKGYKDGTFRPNNQITYSELAKMILEAYKLPKKNTPSFSNIPKTHWMYNYQGIIKEKNLFPHLKNTFPLNDKVTRAHALEFMFQAEKRN